MEIGTISELWRFPVKSMGGELLEQASVHSGGLANDRGWAVREDETGKVASAKSPRKYGALLDYSASVDGEDASARVTITGPNDLHVTSSDPDLSAMLSRVFDRSVTLARASSDEALYESEWPDIEGLVISNTTIDFPVAMSTEKISFVDLAALHLVSTASMAALAALIPDSTIDVRRFRPNLLIDTGATDGFVDSEWVGHELALGDEVVIRVTDNATRCVMTTLGQRDLTQDRSVLQTLAAHNQQEFGGLGTSACIGVYAEVVRPGVIRVGDVVQVAR